VHRTRFLRRWRTIRQYRRRANSGQVAAVATVLGLLLVTTFIASFVLVQLPAEMANNEFVHTILVENQVAQLQSTVLAQSGRPNLPLAQLTPITLGSTGVPPFAPATNGWIVPESSIAQFGLAYSYSRILSQPPNWSATPSCTTGGSPCHADPGWDNITGTPGNTYDIKINGGAPSLFLNFTGNNDSITVTWLGKSVGFVWMEFNGSNNHITLIKGSNGGSGTMPRINVLVYGQNNVLETGMNGQNINFNAFFLGAQDPKVLCPQANLSSSDSFFWNGTNTNTNVTVTWLNSVGYSNSHTITGGAIGAGSTLIFQNVTQFPGGCAWSVPFTAHYSAAALSGIRVHLNNRYSPPADIVYNQGAVILSHPGLGSIMLDGPNMTFAHLASGWTASLTLVSVVGNLSSVQGLETAGISTQLLSVERYLISNQPNSLSFFTGSFLNLTTPYPAAWNSYFHTLPVGALLGPVTCSPLFTVKAPNTCLIPPGGATSVLSVHLSAFSLTVTVITVQASDS
jgi:hypothetical protein